MGGVGRAARSGWCVSSESEGTDWQGRARRTAGWWASGRWAQGDRTVGSGRQDGGFRTRTRWPCGEAGVCGFAVGYIPSFHCASSIPLRLEAVTACGDGSWHTAMGGSRAARRPICRGVSSCGVRRALTAIRRGVGQVHGACPVGVVRTGGVTQTVNLVRRRTDPVRTIGVVRTVDVARPVNGQPRSDGRPHPNGQRSTSYGRSGPRGWSAADLIQTANGRLVRTVGLARLVSGGRRRWSRARPVRGRRRTRPWGRSCPPSPRAARRRRLRLWPARAGASWSGAGR